MVSQIEAVKEEAKTEVMERIKIGSNKICIRNDLARKNMMFSQESRQAIIEIGNVQLLNWRNPEFNARRVYTTYLREQLCVLCGKHIRSNQEIPLSAVGKLLMYWRRLSFVHLSRIREVTSMDLNCGKGIITKQMMRCELLQGRKAEPLLIFGIDGKTIRKIENSQKPLVYIVLLDISNNDADIATWYICVVQRKIYNACRW